MAQQSMKKRQPVKMGGPMGGGMGAGEKAKDFKGTVKKLAKYLAEFRWQMLMVAIFAVGSTTFAIVSPKILGGATNQIVEDYVSMKAYETITSKLPNGASLPAGTTGADVLKRLPNKSEIESQIPSNQLDTIKKLDLSQRPEFHFEAIWRVVILLIGLYVFSAIFRYIQTWLMTQVTQTVTFRMRQQLSEKINRLPLSYFDKQTYGEVLSRVTNDVDTISQTLNQSLSQIVSSTVMVLGILAMMFSISWQMSLVALLVLPLAGGVVTLIAKGSQKQFLRQQTQLGELNGHIEEMYGGHQVMRVFNGQKKSLAKFSRINNQLQESAWKAHFLSGLIYPIMNFIGNIESNGILYGEADVIVADGFVGNIMLKTIEGAVKFMSGAIRQEFQRNLFNKMAAVAALPALKGLKSKLDPRKFNGAILLGLRGIVIKSHGGTDDVGFSYALEEAYHEAKSASLSKIEQGVAEQFAALEAIKAEQATQEAQQAEETKV